MTPLFIFSNRCEGLRSRLECAESELSSVHAASEQLGSQKAEAEERVRILSERLQKEMEEGEGALLTAQEELEQRWVYIYITNQKLLLAFNPIISI